MSCFVGLDLGQANDYTALAILEQHRPTGSRGMHYQGRHLQRFTLGTPYPVIVQEVQTMLQVPRLRGARLIIDATGVGRPVVDMFVAARLRPVAITITGGDKPTQDEADKDAWRVPKRDLVSTMHVLLQAERVKFAEALPDTQVLVKELLNFQVKITATAHDTYGAWREGTHDDLVLAVALAAWAAEHMPRSPFEGLGKGVLTQGKVKYWGS